jgi:ribosomal protein S18 acetylase RimI-like enzyme
MTPKQHAWEMRRLRQQLITDQRYLPIVALLGDGKDTHVVGYTAAIIEHQASLFEVQMVASIDELWVVPEHRGRGIGSALMEELFEQIDAFGIEWVKVQMPVNNEETRAFFDKIGFVQKTVEMQIHLECNR